MTGDWSWQRVLNKSILWLYTIISISFLILTSFPKQFTPNQPKSTYCSMAIKFAFDLLLLNLFLINFIILYFNIFIQIAKDLHWEEWLLILKHIAITWLIFMIHWYYFT
eukprot:281248_1